MPLDPELAAQLERERDMPPRSSLSVGQTRARMAEAVRLSESTGALASEKDHQLGGLLLREYSPATDASLPLVVFLHGGRFFSGCIASHEILCRDLAILSGCRVLAVDYRLAPEHPFPAAVDDVLSAVNWALRNSEQVAVAGDSAGACLAAIAAIERPAVRCQVLFYPMLDPHCDTASHRDFASGYGPGSDDMHSGWLMYNPQREIGPRVSPLYVTDLRGTPPAWILTAEYDCLRDEGEQYARDLRKAGVDVTLVRAPGAIHGFATMTGISRLARSAIVDAGQYIFDRMRRNRD